MSSVSTKSNKNNNGNSVRTSIMPGNNNGVSVINPGGGGGPEDLSQYSGITGLVYIFNLIVGTGALTLPAAFHDAG